VGNKEENERKQKPLQSPPEKKKKVPKETFRRGLKLFKEGHRGSYANKPIPQIRKDAFI